jgi:vacuolar-type H+-ATPase subunit I/STV1
MNMQQLRGFVSLENRKRDLDAELKSVKQQLDDLEEALVPQFIEDGVQRMTVDGRTVSIQQDVYASPLNDREDVVDALKQSELGQYVAENYNTNSLTAFVREVRRDVELRAQSENRMYTEDDVRAALPEPLGRALKISFVHKLSSRKA